MARKKKSAPEATNTEAPNVSAALARAFAQTRTESPETVNEEMPVESAAETVETTLEAVETTESVETTDSVETTEAVQTLEAEASVDVEAENTDAVADETLEAQGENTEAASEVEATVAAEAAADAPAVDTTKITDFGEIEQAVESLVFASTRPISLQRMKNALNHFNYDLSQLGDVLKSLEQKYENSGFQLVKVAGGYQLRSNPKQSDLLQRILEDKPAKLGTSALEVLAIVAYKQPVTRSEIDAVRGTDSGHLMKGLLEKNLVRSLGHAETPGRPMIYGTTSYFLEVFSLNSLDDMPAVDEFVRELGPDADAAPGGEGNPLVLAADGGVGATGADAAFFDRPSPLSAEPDRGAFDEPAEDRFETPDFGAAEPEAKA